MNPGTSLAALLRAEAATLRAQADRFDALADSSERESITDAVLDLKALGDRFGFSRESLMGAAGKGLQVHRGPRGKLMVFERDVLHWIRSRAWTPASRRCDDEPENEALDRACDELLAFSGSDTRPSRPKTPEETRLTEKQDELQADSGHLRIVGGAS